MEVTECDVKGTSGASAAPLAEDTNAESPTRQQSASTQHQMKLIKPLLSSASRLGKALVELFGLLVKVRPYKFLFLFYLFIFILFYLFFYFLFIYFFFFLFHTS